ncbi:MAG: MFS transporter, partial [Daejeonella sp.]
KEIGLVVAVYPAFWGFGQLFTGKLGDIVCKKTLLFWGMLMQGIAIMVLPQAVELYHYFFISAFLGIGTAIVYPTFLVAIAEDTHPSQRPESIGIFRFWRDSGYAFGAILSGILADIYGITTAVISIGVLTVMSAVLINYRMKCKRQNETSRPWRWATNKPGNETLIIQS